MHDAITFLFIVGTIYTCYIANSYLVEKFYASPPHNIDVRWIGLVFEGVWSMVLAETYRLIHNAYSKAHSKEEHMVCQGSTCTDPSACGEQEQKQTPNSTDSGIITQEKNKDAKPRSLRNCLYAFAHPEDGMTWAQTLFTCEVMLTIGKVFALLALKYVSYTTSMVSKSSKTLGILLAALLMGNMEYITAFRVVTVIFIVVGSIIYSHAELKMKIRSSTSDTPHPLIGYILMFLSEVANGFGCTYQDISVAQHKKQTGKVIQTNVIQLMSGICTLVAGVVLVLCYNTMNDVVMLFKTPAWLFNQNVASMLLTLGLIPIIYSLKLYGSLITGIISTVRKLITVLISMFMTNAKPSPQNWLGIGLTFTGLTISIFESKLTKALGLNKSKKNKKD